MSPEHLHCYVTEFEGRHNDLDTELQMAEMVRGAEGKRPACLKLTAHGAGGRRARAV